MAERPPKLLAYESLLRQTTRLRVVGVYDEDEFPTDPCWGEVTGATLAGAIERLAASDEGFKDRTAIACMPMCVYELYDGARRLGVITPYGGGLVALDGAIARLARGAEIEAWLAARGVKDPRRTPR